MGLLTDFAQAYARGYACVSGNGNGILDRLCRENGWDIDERKGDGIALHFKGDRITPQRSVVVIHPGADQIMIFICNCRAEFSNRTLPDDLPAAMMVHNHDMTLGAWNAKVDGGTVSLSLKYTALTAGVDAASFRKICTLLVKEVAEVEANLHRKGLL